MHQKKTRPARPFSVLGLILAVMVRAAAAGSAESVPSDWATGRVFRDRLDLAVSVYWSGEPFRTAVVGLGRTQRIAVLVDRRVDPDQPIEFSMQNAPLGQVFQELARRRGLGCCLFGPVVYFGPRQAAADLRTVAEMARDEVRKLPLALAKKFAAPAALRWDDLATPRDLLSGLAGEAGLSVDAVERLPHDLWAAVDLPPMPLADRLTLVAFQFDLTYQVSPQGDAIRLTPMPEQIAVVRSYAGGKEAAARSERWRQLVPESQIKVAGERIYVKGRLEDQERITASLRPPAPRPAAGRPATQDLNLKRFSLKIRQQPLGPLLEQLARRLAADGLELTFDLEAIGRAGVSLDQLVSFEVDQATIDELLQAMLKDTGCSFRRQGSRVEIRPQ